MYRTTGDEFVVLYRGKQPEKLAKAIQNASQDEEKPDFLGVSIGYEFVRTDSDLKQALHNADQMMYKNKTKRRASRP